MIKRQSRFARSAGTGALVVHRRLGRGEHVLGGAVGFLLLAIAWRGDRAFRLDQPTGGPVADHPLEAQDGRREVLVGDAVVLDRGDDRIHRLCRILAGLADRRSLEGHPESDVCGVRRQHDATRSADADRVFGVCRVGGQRPAMDLCREHQLGRALPLPRGRSQGFGQAGDDRREAPDRWSLDPGYRVLE